MVSCCLPHSDLGWESPAAPCKSQHCWQPKSPAAHSPGKKICEKGVELPLPICFLFSLHLFIHLFSVCLRHKIHLRRIFLLPSSLPPPPREDTCKCLSISFKKGLFSSSWPPLAVPSFCSGWIVRCQGSSAAIPAAVQTATGKEMHGRERKREKRNC